VLRLVCANLNYSSWSLRPWLALERAGAPYKPHDVGFKTRDGWKDRILSFSGAGRVPILIDGSLSVHESLAICEYVAELFPEAQLWPSETALRARGRAISCEMLSSFSALRSAMPMNIRARSRRPQTEPNVDADIARILQIWDASMNATGGPFLLGSFSIADCMYAPVVTRFRTYGVELPASARSYSEAIFSLPEFAKLEQLIANEPAIAESDAYINPQH
jgi:glutathione S-transferase